MVAASEGSVAEREQENESQCAHHWLIDVAGGPKSKGVCRICGAERLFKNALDRVEWDNGDSTSTAAPRMPVATAASSDDESPDDL